jgi:hypothetical protein
MKEISREEKEKGFVVFFNFIPSNIPERKSDAMNEI